MKKENRNKKEKGKRTKRDVKEIRKRNKRNRKIKSTKKKKEIRIKKIIKKKRTKKEIENGKERKTIFNLISARRWGKMVYLSLPFRFLISPSFTISLVSVLCLLLTLLLRKVKEE